MREPHTNPLSGLESSGAAMSPLPAAEVRRRGDRLRRRNTAGLLLGSAALVVAVAMGGSWLSSSRPDAVPPATPATTSPAPTDPPTSSPATPPTTEPAAPVRSTRIPADFPLNDGWPGSENEMTEPSADYVSWLAERQTACGDPLPSADPASRLTSIWTGPSESRSRELLTFDTGQAARRWVTQTRAVYAACGPTPAPEVPADRVTRVQDVDLLRGDQTWEARMTLEVDGRVVPGQYLVQVTRLGHVVFINAGSDGGSDAATMSGDYFVQSDGVLAAVCEQIEGACPRPRATDASGAPSALAAFPLRAEEPPASELVGQGDVPDLDLGADLPDMTGDGGELLPAAPDVAAADRLLVCGQPVVSQAHQLTGRLAASSSGPEFFAFRQVIGFRDAAEAQAQMSELRSLLRGCPRQATPRRTTEVGWETVAADTGYDTVTFGSTYFTPGSDQLAGTGGDLVQFTRVGRAVVVVGTEGEYSGSESLAFAAPELTRVSRQLAPLLCGFTAAGC